MVRKIVLLLLLLLLLSGLLVRWLGATKLHVRRRLLLLLMMACRIRSGVTTILWLLLRKW